MKTLKQLRKLWKDGGTRGGESNSPAKITAAKVNAQKAREALALKRARDKEHRIEQHARYLLAKFDCENK